VNLVNFDKFAVDTMDIRNWWNEFYRLNFKIHDHAGFFGAERFDYFCYGNKNEINKTGVSVTYILLHTEKSLSKLPNNKYREVKERMSSLGVDVDKVISKKEIIYASDSNSRFMINGSSITVFFSLDNQDEKQPERNNQDG